MFGLHCMNAASAGQNGRDAAQGSKATQSPDDCVPKTREACRTALVRCLGGSNLQRSDGLADCSGAWHQLCLQIEGEQAGWLGTTTHRRIAKQACTHQRMSQDVLLAHASSDNDVSNQLRSRGSPKPAN